MKVSVSITGKERTYLARESDSDKVGDKTFNQILSLNPRDVSSRELRELTQYVRGMNQAFKRLTEK